MFGRGYSKPVQSAVDDDDDANMLGGGKSDFLNAKDDFRTRQNYQSSRATGFGGGSFGNSNNGSSDKDPFKVDKDEWLKGNDANDPFGGKSSKGGDNNKKSGFGGGSFGNSDYGSSDKDPFKVDKDEWMKGNDANDPFGGEDSKGGNNGKKSGSLFGDPFNSSSSSSSSSGFGRNSNNEFGSNSGGGFGPSSSNSSANFNDPFAAPSSPPKLADYYISEAAAGMDSVYCCISCYNKMTKKLATNFLKLKPNDSSANYGGNMSTTSCDVCQKNLREVRDAIGKGSPMNTTGIGSDSKGAFPRPSMDGNNNSRSSGDNRASFGGGDGRTSFGNEGRGSMDSRGSDDMTSGMIRMQAGGKSNSVFGGMFSGSSKGRKY